MIAEVMRLIEVDRHGDGDDLDRLAGLVQHRAHEHLHEVGIADRHRERGVLGEVEVLARQRRDDDPHRLRDHDEAQRLPGTQPERARGLGLALRHREDAGPHHLGDEARGVGDEPDQERHELRIELHAAAEVEALKTRDVEGDRLAADQGEHDPDERREADDEAERAQPDGVLPSGLLLLPFRPDMEGDRADDAGHEHERDEPGVLGEDRLRQVEAALVEEEKVADVERLPRVGQGREHRDVPEQELQQQREVADHLDIDHRHLGDDPVLREARDADDEAEDRGEENADRRHHKRVEKPHQEGVAIG
jgi:hypothetical protein